MKKICYFFAVLFIYCSCSTNNNNGTVTVVPLAPGNLTGTVISTTQINLSWTDNATNEAGYKIERKTGNGNYAVVGSMGADLTTYNDLGLTPNTSYTYRVYAYNSAGNSLQYSNEVTISTQDSIPTWLTNGLVAYYPFNGNANDESGNGNNGTVNGATLTRDRLGNGSKAYSFDGVNDFINCGIFNLNSNQISINLWINESAVSSNRNVIISKYDGVSYPGDNSISRTFSLIRHDASYQNRFHAQISFDGINTFESFSSEFGVPQIWRMITISYDGNLLKWYFNGVFHSQVQINSLSNLFSSNTPIYVGCFSDGNSPESALGFFNGQIDDIRIYNRALSQSEITYLATH